MQQPSSAEWKKKNTVKSLGKLLRVGLCCTQVHGGYCPAGALVEVTSGQWWMVVQVSCCFLSMILCSCAGEGQAAEPHSSWDAQSSSLQTRQVTASLRHKMPRRGVIPSFGKCAAGALPHPDISGRVEMA